MMNRKAEGISATLITIVVLIIAVIAMAAFVTVAYFSSLTKGQSNSQINLVNIESGSILFKSVTISNSHELVSEYMIRQYANGDKFSTKEFDSDIESIMKNDLAFSGRSSCVFLTIGNFQDYYSDFYLGNTNLYESAFFYKDSSNTVTKYSDINDVLTLLGEDTISSSAVQIPVSVGDKNFTLIGYYGGCAK